MTAIKGNGAQVICFQNASLFWVSKLLAVRIYSIIAECSHQRQSLTATLSVWDPSAFPEALQIVVNIICLRFFETKPSFVQNYCVELRGVAVVARTLLVAAMFLKASRN